MDKQDFNLQDKQSLRTNGRVAAADAEKLTKFIKAASVFVVFAVSFSIPFLCALLIQESAKQVRMKSDLSQISNWAEVYKLENGSYRGLEDGEEIKRVFDDIKSMGGEGHIYVGRDRQSYCAKVVFKKGSFCVDSASYKGEDNGICSSESARCSDDN